MLWQMKTLSTSDCSSWFTRQNKVYLGPWCFFPLSFLPRAKIVCEPWSGRHACAVGRRRDLLAGAQGFAVPVGHRVQWQEEAKSRHTIRRPSRTRTYSTGHHAGKKEASRDDRKTCRGRKQGARPAREKEVRGKRDGSAKKRMEIAMAKSRPRQGGMPSFHWTHVVLSIR
jgi:hypothetical protein